MCREFLVGASKGSAIGMKNTHTFDRLWINPWLVRGQPLRYGYEKYKEFL
jgi:hypothetical protein